MSKGRISEEQQAVPAAAPVDLTTAGIIGDWVSLANFNHAVCRLATGVGTAAQDPTITIQQATDNAGAGAKALDFTDIYQKEAVDISTIGQFTLITQTAANTYQSLTGGESQQLIQIEFDAAALDVDNGFDHIQISVSDPGAASKIGYAEVVLTQARNAEEPALSAI